MSRRARLAKAVLLLEHKDAAIGLQEHNWMLATDRIGLRHSRAAQQARDIPTYYGAGRMSAMDLMKTKVDFIMFEVRATQQ